MKIKVWTFTSDTDSGMQTGVFATERAAYEAFNQSRCHGGKVIEADEIDRAESLLNAAIQTGDFSDLNEFLQSTLEGTLDSYSVEEHELDMAAPYVLITVSGGVAEVAVNEAETDVDILDYDNLKESLSYPDEKIELTEGEIAHIRATEDGKFIAKVEKALAIA